VKYNQDYQSKTPPLVSAFGYLRHNKPTPLLYVSNLHTLFPERLRLLPNVVQISALPQSVRLHQAIHTDHIQILQDQVVLAKVVRRLVRLLKQQRFKQTYAAAIILVNLDAQMRQDAFDAGTGTIRGDQLLAAYDDVPEEQQDRSTPVPLPLMLPPRDHQLELADHLFLSGVAAIGREFLGSPVLLGKEEVDVAKHSWAVVVVARENLFRVLGQWGRRRDRGQAYYERQLVRVGAPTALHRVFFVEGKLFRGCGRADSLDPRGTPIRLK